MLLVLLNCNHSFIYTPSLIDSKTKHTNNIIVKSFLFHLFSPFILIFPHNGQPHAVLSVQENL